MFSNWTYTVDHPREYLPRQFEYHPRHEDLILLGTQDGKIATLNSERKEVRFLGSYGADEQDSILGLCWFRHDPLRFIAGSSNGRLKCGSIDERLESSIVTSYSKFRGLSSVHINCNDSKFCVSGNKEPDAPAVVAVYDLATGVRCTELKGIHDDSINISRFTYHSPDILATCSFDCKLKLWDLRMPSSREIYSIETPESLVMINFSPSDAFILSSGADNEVHQYLVADGRKHVSFKIPKSGADLNFTRSYYSASGAFILTGGSEEDCLHMLSSATGDLIVNIPLFPGSDFSSSYVQSLRTCPNNERRFAALVNDRVLPYRQIVNVNMDFSCILSDSNSGSGDCHHSDIKEMATSYLETFASIPPTEKYIEDLDMNLWRNRSEPATAAGRWMDGIIYLTHRIKCKFSFDRTLLSLVCNGDTGSDGMSLHFPVHSAVILARCPVLAQRFLDLIYSTESQGTFADGVQEPLVIPMDEMLELSELEADSFQWVMRYLYSTTIDMKDISDSCALFFGLPEICTDFMNGKLKYDGSLECLLVYLVAMLKVGNQLKLHELVQHISCILSSLIRNNTVVFIIYLAITNNCVELLECCTLFLSAHLELVILNCITQFKQMNSVHLQDSLRYSLEFVNALYMLPHPVLDSLYVNILDDHLAINIPPESQLCAKSQIDWSGILYDVITKRQAAAQIHQNDKDAGDLNHAVYSVIEEEKSSSQPNFLLSNDQSAKKLEQDSSIGKLTENTENYPLTSGFNGDCRSKLHDKTEIFDIPSMFSHSSNLLFNEMMMVLGGRNKTKLFTYDTPYIYYPRVGKWGLIQTFGQIPPLQSSTVVISLEQKDNRNLLFIADRFGSWEFYLLDCMTMIWSLVEYDEDTMLKAAAVFKRHKGVISPIIRNDDDSVHPKHQAGRFAAGSKSKTPYLVLFGGYCFDSRTAKNDLIVLSIEECHEQANSKRNNISDLKSTAANMNLRRISRLGDSIIQNTALNFKIVPRIPNVFGTPASPRWGSSSAMMWHSDSSSTASDLLIINGGICSEFVEEEHDIHVVNCRNPNELVWVQVEVAGSSPGIRVGHSMTSVSSDKILFYGGIQLERSMFSLRYNEPPTNDVWCLHLIDYNAGVAKFIWTNIRSSIPSSLMPKRMKHSSIAYSSGIDMKLIVFGGVHPDNGVHGENCIEQNRLQTIVISSESIECQDESLAQSFYYRCCIPRHSRSPYHLHHEFKMLRTNNQAMCDLLLQASVSVESNEERESDLPVIENTIYPCHSVILSLRSKTLAAMVNWFTLNSNSSKISDSIMERRKIELNPDCVIDKATIENFVNYLYCGTLNIDPAHILELAIMADEYSAEDIFIYCEGYLIRRIEESNACYLLSCTERVVFSKMMSLKAAAIGFISISFDKISMTEDYIELSEYLKLEIDSFRRK